MTHPQPRDLCLSLCPCATHVLYIQDNTVIKPHLVNSPPFSCQILEVPLCPDFELACPPVASAKAKHWCVCSCVKTIGLRSPDCVCGACQKLRVPGKELTHRHSIIWRIPLDCSTSSQIQGAWVNVQYNKGVVMVGSIHDHWEARVCSVWFDYHGKRGGKPMDKTVAGKIFIRVIKQAAYLRTRYGGSAPACSWVCFPSIPTATWQKHNGFLLVWSQLQAGETSVQRKLSLPTERVSTYKTVWSSLVCLSASVTF